MCFWHIYLLKKVQDILIHLFIGVHALEGPSRLFSHLLQESIIGSIPYPYYKVGHFALYGFVYNIFMVIDFAIRYQKQIAFFIFVGSMTGIGRLQCLCHPRTTHIGIE